MIFIRARQLIFTALSVLIFGAPFSAAAQETPTLPPIPTATPSGPAQQLEPDAPAESGAIAIMQGFQPDPFRVRVIGGGDVDALTRNLGEGCVGMISVTPDFRVRAQTPLPLLRFIYISETITTDTTLVVRTPTGEFLCNNNSAGLFNPTVDAVNAPPGDYAVWVGGFTPTQPVYGDLYVTSNANIRAGTTGLNAPIVTATPSPQVTSPATPTPLPGTFLDPAALPIHGAERLSAGFLPDPYWTVVIAGGALGVPELDADVRPVQLEIGGGPVTSECAGFTESAPDFKLAWSGQSTRLRFQFIPVGTLDTSLIVHAPDGTWRCNRDFAPGFTEPLVEFTNPIAGEYAVWLAVEDAPLTFETGVLYVSEIASLPTTVRQAVTTPRSDLVGLDSFAPAAPLTFDGSLDPLALPASGGGLVDLAALNPFQPGITPPNTDCEGHYNAAPTFSLNLAQPTPYLRIFFVGESLAGERVDPTLVVRMPDGRFYCGDDSFDTLNPTVNIIGNLATGTAQIWIGSYDADHAVSGTLVLTRGSANPTDPHRPGPSRLIPTDVLPTPTFPLLNAADYIATPSPDPDAAPVVTGGLLPDAPANFGQTALAAGFGSHSVGGYGGGDLNAAVVSSGCVGFVTAAPDYRVEWAGGAALRFAFSGEGDATLIVRDPQGGWHCADDSFGTTDPAVDILTAPPGAYTIWVGSYDAGGVVPGTLFISENPN